MDYDSFCAICTVVCACTITICATIYRVIRKGNNFMTQAEKARAYDEAIKRAKEINNEQKAQPFDVMLKVFPELKESDDEKIKKWIIGVLSTYEHDRDLRNAAISWLKKQGKQPIYKTPSREIILSIWDLGNEWKELTKGSISTEYGTQLDYIQKHWQESEYYLRAKQSEQKSYGQRAECLDCQFNYAGECKGTCAMKRDEQKLTEWSEEDEKMLDDAYIMLDWYKGNNWWTAQHIKNWLKSIKQRIWWKPTKEQSEKEPIINVPSRNGMYICDKCSFPISQQDEYELVAKRIEQKPAWSEEDERKYEYIRGCIYHCCVPADAEYLCDWLETQLSK